MKLACHDKTPSCSHLFMVGRPSAITWVKRHYLTTQYLYFTDLAKFNFKIQGTIEVRVHTLSYFVFWLKSYCRRESYETRRNKGKTLKRVSLKCWERKLIIANTMTVWPRLICLGCFLLVKQCWELSQESILYKILDGVKHISSNSKSVSGFLTVHNVIPGIEWRSILSHLNHLHP